MRNTCAFLLGMLCAQRSFDVFYAFVSIFRFRCSFEAYLAIFVILGYLAGKLLRRLPGLPAGYALYILTQLQSDLPYLGARLFGSCGNGVRGAQAELTLACLASGMLGSTLFGLAGRRVGEADSGPGLNASNPAATDPS